MKNFFCLQGVVNHRWRIFLSKKAKKKFGGKENGCTFASAFAEKRAMLKKAFEGDGSARCLKRMKQEIACVQSCRPEGLWRETRESQR